MSPVTLMILACTILLFVCVFVCVHAHMHVRVRVRVRGCAIKDLTDQNILLYVGGGR